MANVQTGAMASYFLCILLAGGSIVSVLLYMLGVY